MLNGIGLCVLCKRMKILQSKSGIKYEYDPCVPPIKVDAYWSCFSGNRISFAIPEPVIIYIPIIEESERILMWLKNCPLSYPNLTCPIDYIVETECNPFGNKTIKCLYIIENVYDCVSLSSLMKGQKNGINEKPIEFANQMYDMYQHNRICFARIVAIEILKGLEQLHIKGDSIGCIDPDNILFAEDKRITINFMGAYHWYLVKQAFFLQSHTHSIVISLIGAIGAEHETMIAPEMLYGINDNRSDLYSLGILLFGILAGHLPYSVEELSITHQKVPLHEIKDKQFRRIIKKAAEKNPSKQFQSTMEFINALEICDKVHIPWHKRFFFNSLTINGLE